MNKRVVVGMSGGVDSSVCAYLLKKKGYEVIGITMNMFEASDGDKIISDAKDVCDKLDIEHHVIDMKKTFNDSVIDYFIKEYFRGNTPNPCIACNKHIKWKALYDKAKEFDVYYVATGHYAKVIKNDEDNLYYLKRADDDRKDQTYVLYNLTQDNLKHILMPLGDYTKQEIRDIAEKIGIDLYNKPDSQEICFIKDNNYIKFLNEKSNLISKKGNFVDVKGKILGEHNGIINYTIGQRKGLNISFGKPMYVIDINVDKNEVILGENDELFTNRLTANRLNFLLFDRLEKEMEVTAKIRYGHKPSKAKIKMISKDIIECVFEEKQRAITRGQAVVFYINDILLGGGTIL